MKKMYILSSLGIALLSMSMGNAAVLADEGRGVSHPPASAILFNQSIEQLFPDPNLAEKVAERLGKEVTSEVSTEELQSIVYLDASASLVKNLEGVQYLTNIVTLWLDHNRLTDVSQLGGLKNLEVLSLSFNNIANMSISGLQNLPNLRNLDLRSSNIQDIQPISNLSNLKVLDLSYNPINDITPLTKILNLHDLNLDSISCRDFSSLVQLVNLDGLRLGGNEISDLSFVSVLSKLNVLEANHNKISDLSPLSNLDLYRLTLSYNLVSDLSPLAELVNLSEATLVGNQIKDISDLGHVRTLHARNQLIELPLGHQGLGTSIHLRDQFDTVPDLQFITPGTYQDDLLTWNQVGENMLAFGNSTSDFSGEIVQTVEK